MKFIPLVIAGCVVFGGSYLITKSMGHGEQSVAEGESGAAIVEVIPAGLLTQAALSGKAEFDANCAQCHGENGAGRLGMGPPLIHKVYEPGHHGDMSFQMAVANGVRAHHWPFGDMPPVEGITEEQVTQITTYIRETQRANGIN